jgi:spore coat protein U-like protein
MPVTRAGLRAALMALFGAFALWLAVSPQPAQANIVCSASPQVVNFGSTQTATGVVNYSCQNTNPVATSFTLCLQRGTPQYPGDAAQPRMQRINGGDQLDYNLYTNSARTTEWVGNTYLSRAISIPAGQVSTGSFTYYGRIRAGQVVPLGDYRGFIHQTKLGFVPTGVQRCDETINPGFQGVNFTVTVQATVAANCTLGARAAIDFGTQPGLFTRADATGSVQLTCPLSRAWTLTFDGGRYASSNVRRMRSAAGNYVPYTIYRDANRTNAIAVNGTVTGIGTGAAQTSNIYGRTQPPSPPPIGTYQDFIVVTLSF